MLGHEGARRLLEQALAVAVPARLAMIRDRVPPVPVAGAPQVWPPDPKVLCADVIPDRSDWLPAVMVGSTKLEGLRAMEGGIGQQWLCTYSGDVAVAVVADNPASETLASVGRDRLLLAVREALLTHSRLADGVAVQLRGLTEDTGPVSEDMAARPMCGGVIPITIQAVEALDEHRWPITDASSTLGDTRPAGVPFPTEEE